MPLKPTGLIPRLRLACSLRGLPRSAADCRRALARAVPGLEAAALRELSARSFFVFACEREVFRVPQAAWARRWLPHETALLQRLEGKLPLATPAARRQAGRLPLQRYPLLPGRTLAELLPPEGVAEAEQGSLGAALGGFLAALQSQPLPPRHPTFRDPARVHAGRIRRALASLEAAGPALAPGAEAAVAVALALPPASPRLLHGDLLAGNLLVDSALRPSGVIDFSLATAGDPAWDFRLAALLGPACLEAALAACGAAGGTVPAAGRIEALTELWRCSDRLTRALRRPPS